MIKIKMNLNNIKETSFGNTEIIEKITTSNAINTFRQIKVDRLLSTGELIDIGHVINASENLSALFSLPDKEFKKLMQVFLKLIADNNNIKITNVSGKKYIGLLNFTQNICSKNNTNVELNKFIMDEEIQFWVLDAIFNCDLNNIENLRKIAIDCNVIYRLLGERTIDAFKKFYNITYSFIQENLKAKSTLHFKDDVDYINYDKLGTQGYDFIVEYKDKNADLPDINNNILNYSELELGKYCKYDVTSILDSDNKYCYFYQDAISEIRESIRYSFHEFINKDIPDLYNNANIDKAGLNKINKNYFAIMRKLYVNPYSIAQINKIESLKKITEKLELDGNTDAYIEAKDNIINSSNETINELSNEFRTFVKLSGIAPEEAGALMYAISNYRLNNVDKYEPKSNQCFLNVAPEYFVSYYAHRFNKTKAYSKLYGNISKLDNYITNGTVEVRNGYIVGSDLSISCDCNYNGIAHVEYIWNKDYTVKEPYIYVDINNLLFNDIDMTDNKIKVIVYKTSFIDLETTKVSANTVYFKNNVTSIFDILIQDADVIFEFLPTYKYTKKLENKIKTVTMQSVMVAHKGNNTIPVANFACGSNELQAIYAGLKINAKDIKISEDSISINISFDIKDASRNTDVVLWNYDVSIDENEKMINETNDNNIFNLTTDSNSPFEDTSNEFIFSDDDSIINESDFNESDFNESDFNDDDFGFDIDDALNEFDE